MHTVVMKLIFMYVQSTSIACYKYIIMLVEFENAYTDDYM